MCDLVKEDPEDGGPFAIEIVQERLEDSNANVVLRTLSLIVSLAENCGSRLQQSISSKAFTKLLQSLIDNSDVHMLVKQEVAKMVEQLSDSFKRDASLKSMQDLHLYIKNQTPHLLAKHDIPQKRELVRETKRNEEQELEEASFETVDFRV